MRWIASPSGQSAPPHVQPAAQAPAASIEYPSRVSARGVAPGQAVIEQLSATECRFRTVLFFVPNDVVELEFGNGTATNVRGRILSRLSIGPRFSYRITLDIMSARETDTLARALATTYRRDAMSRSLDRLKTSISTTDQPTRTSHRVVAQFPLLYRCGSEAFKSASAGDISASGLLMVANERCEIGATLDLRFTLPSDVLAVYPEETVTLDTRRNTITPGKRVDARRPFEEMSVAAIVATSGESIRGVYASGLEFTRIEGLAREQIARYVHATQLSHRL